MSARDVPVGAFQAPDDWVSYIDPESQQEYWYVSTALEQTYAFCVFHDYAQY